MKGGGFIQNLYLENRDCKGLKGRIPRSRRTISPTSMPTEIRLHRSVQNPQRAAVEMTAVIRFSLWKAITSLTRASTTRPIPRSSASSSREFNAGNAVNGKEAQSGGQGLPHRPRPESERLAIFLQGATLLSSGRTSPEKLRSLLISSMNPSSKKGRLTLTASAATLRVNDERINGK